MKKLLITLTALAISAPVFAKSNLPFVGERSFNFEQSACSEQVINIAKNGDTTITFVGCNQSITLYQGKYQAYLPTHWGDDNDIDKGFYQIKGDTIYALDKDKKPLMGCVGSADTPCQSGLYQ